MLGTETLALLCDYYELTMGRGYFHSGMAGRITYFDVFFRRVPDGGGYAVFAGLEQIANYIENLRFSESDIEYLRSKGTFDEEFLEYLRHFRFTGDIYAVPEGTVIFPGEPIITVRAPAIEAQLVETYILLCVNHQSLIATKASRMVRAAAGRHLPAEWATRKKRGFPVPIRYWLQQEKYASVVRGYFESDYAALFFDRKKILALLDEHVAKKTNNARKIWTVYTFLVWYKRFFIEQ